VQRRYYGGTTEVLRFYACSGAVRTSQDWAKSIQPNQSSRAEVRCLILFVSVVVAWIKKCFNPRRATLSGFFDGMTAKQSQKALSHS